MTKENIVDDYYSNLNNTSSNTDNSNSTKAKIKAKIVKKEETIIKPEQVKTDESKKPVFKIKAKVVENPVSNEIQNQEKAVENKASFPKKQFHQKIDVIAHKPRENNSNSNNNSNQANKPRTGFNPNYKGKESNYNPGVHKPRENNSNSNNTNHTSNNSNNTNSNNNSNQANKPRTGFNPNYKGNNNTNTGSSNNFNSRSDSSNSSKETNNNFVAKQFTDNKPAFKKSNSVSKFSKDSREEKARKNKFRASQEKNKRFRFGEDEKDVGFVRAKKIDKKKKEEKNIEDIKQNLVDHTGETIIIPEILTLKELSEKTGVALPKLLAEFMKNGMMVNINSKIDFDSAAIICEAFNIILNRDNSTGLKVEDLVSGDLSSLFIEDDVSKLLPRPPVISIMGHVDHGKTSLLDYIRKAKVADGEAGGITQSIGAYQAEHNGQKITFLDTPGHEAFTVMRARGAKSTDIAVLVVAADEGVKPQTIESINHAKEAGIPVIVAVNKMDKEGANPDHIKSQLAEHGLTPEDWGGDTPMVPVSAHTGFGIDDLLEIILLMSEMKELKANPDRAGVATVLESHLDLNLGPVATVLVNSGTINKTDNIVCNDAFGKIKVLRNYENVGVIKALPGDPVLIIGLDRVVAGGDILQVVASPAIAREKATEYRENSLKNKQAKSSGLEILMSKIKAGSLKQLKVVVKADTNGSLEAIKNALGKLSTPETIVQIIHSGVGNITEGDVLMCSGSGAVLIGFGVAITQSAKPMIEDTKIEFIQSEIIYHITDKIEKIVTGMFDPKMVERFLGKAKVAAIFFTEKKFMIVGLKISNEGDTIETASGLRVIRDKKMIGQGKIGSLKSGVEEVKMLEGPIECGIKFEGNIALEIGDELEIFKIEVQK